MTKFSGSFFGAKERGEGKKFGVNGKVNPGMRRCARVVLLRI